jgi:hypothetical protein
MNSPTVPTALEKAALIEKLAHEIMAASPEGSLEYQFAALVVMDAMAIQGRKSPLKGKLGKR